MYNVSYNIKVTQRTNGRTEVLVFDFVEKYEWDSSWKNMTDKGTISLPKNLYYTDKDGAKHPLAGSTANVGGYTENPFFMRGDKIRIDCGYWYETGDGAETKPPLTTIFTGYITKVNPKMPVQIECEDNMYILKQVLAPNMVFKQVDYTAETMVKYLLV